ncbi:transporter substrate-binding domain-containing protein [Rhodoferax sp.]|uniref:transporter substrate-binding domain-containing protein n=1 Tax=Rhodoferax sp. TaxID=50421 RepID=UPI00374CD47B
MVKIAQTGRIVLGVQDTAMPLSYLDASGAHVGYHLDVCLRLVAAIQQRFELPKLKVITVPTSLTTRFALLDNRTIDIECGNNAINSSSMQQALLTHATMVSEIRLMTVAANKDWTIANLAGKSVGIEAGSPATPALRSLSRNSVPKIKETFGRMTGDTFALLEAGRVDAVALPTPSMLAQRALSADPSHYVLIDGVLRTDPVALMFRLQDESLQALANDVIDSMMRTGEMARLYDKWFMRPIPGLTEPVGIPLPPMLRALFDAPGSEMRGI